MAAALCLAFVAWACGPEVELPLVEPTDSPTSIDSAPTGTPAATPLPTQVKQASPVPTENPPPNIFAVPGPTPRPLPTPIPTIILIPTPAPTRTPTVTPTPTPFPTPLPLIFRVFPSSQTTMQLRWTTTLDDIERLAIYRDGVLIANPSAEERTYRDPGLGANRQYTYRLDVARANDVELSAEQTRATLVYAPLVTRQMATKGTRLQLPIIDERNPDHTEYRVTMSWSGVEQITSPWSTDKCRTLTGLEPGQRYSVSVHARNLDGTTERAIDHIAEEGSPETLRGRVATTWAHSGTEDRWVQGRIRDTVAVHGLTQAAEDWMNNTILIERNRGIPWHRSSGNGVVGIGHSNVGHLMADVMRVYWEYWDGFPEPCDRMNIYTFRRDVAQFALDFRSLERSDGENHLAPWRPYYNLIVAVLALQDLEGEDYWDVLERGEYGKFGSLWHELESTIPGFNPHHPSLIPPRIRKYFEGFMQADPGRTWDEELDWHANLEEEDRRLWFPLVTHAIHHNTPHVPSYTSGTRIPEPLRTTLRNADRQFLVDFINTLEDQSPFGWWTEHRRYWNFYVSFHLDRFQVYKSELNAAAGIELEDANLNAVAQALQALHTLHCPPGSRSCYINREARVENGAAQVSATINSIRPLSEGQREILKAMTDLST